MVKYPQVGKVYRFMNFINEPFIFITRLDKDKGTYYYYELGKEYAERYAYLDTSTSFLEEI